MIKKKTGKTKILDESISNALIALGYDLVGGCELYPGASGLKFAKSVADGQVVFAFASGVSNNHALFVTAKIGVQIQPLDTLLNVLQKDSLEQLAYPYSSLAWSIGENYPEFDPEPFHPGTQFAIPDDSIDSSLILLCKRLERWTNEALAFLTEIPVYDFFRFDARIDKSYRWRELVAILKLVRGEEYVGMQLLNDLVDEAAGRRAILGDYDSPYFKNTGLRRNEYDLAFREALRASARTAIKGGAFDICRAEVDAIIANGKPD